MKKILTIIFIVVSQYAYLQTASQQNGSTGVGTLSPHPSALLDLSSSSKGLLIPRVKLKSDTSKTPIVNPITSLLVYNNRDTSNVVEGFYYWNDSIWIPLVSSLTIKNYESTDWRLQGNAVQSSQFLGTTNNSPIRLKINNNHSGFISSRNLAIGYNSMASGIPGSNNVAFGNSALMNCSNSKFNTAIGDSALALYNDDGTGSNTAVGFNAQKNVSGNSAVENTAVGRNAMITNTEGYRNTAIGAYADIGTNSSSNLYNATAIGYEAQINSSNAMAFGNTSVEKWVFGRKNSPTGEALTVGTVNTNGNGAHLTNGGAWTNASDKNLKDDIVRINTEEILNKVCQLPISKWKYKHTNEYHIGPMAQDFYQLFSLGLNNTSISTIDPAGVALAAIQELYKENQDLKRKIEDMALNMSELKEMIQLAVRELRIDKNEDVTSIKY
jgi:hypothetical protein